MDINRVESLLFSGHQLLAGAMRTPELRLEKEEAHAVAEALANVTRHYPIGVDDKAMDWGNLALTLGAVYGSRAIALRNKRAAARNQQSGPVQTERPQPTPQPGPEAPTPTPPGTPPQQGDRSPGGTIEVAGHRVDTNAAQQSLP